MLGFLFFRAGGILTVDPIYETTGGLSVAGLMELTEYLVVIFVIIILALIVGRRGMCHLFCPISVIMMIGRIIRNIFRLAAVQLTAEKEKRIQCGKCTKECTHSLDVASMVKDNQMEQQECTLCEVCADVCPRDVIILGFDRPNWKNPFDIE